MTPFKLLPVYDMLKAKVKKTQRNCYIGAVTRIRCVRADVLILLVGSGSSQGKNPGSTETHLAL